MAFHCQQCHAPIKLDESLKNLSQAHRELLVNKATRASKPPRRLSKEHIPQDRLDVLNQALDDIRENPTSTEVQNFSDLVSEPIVGSAGSDGSAHSFVYVSDHNDDDESDHNEVPEEKAEEQLPDFSRIKSLDQVFHILSTNQDVSHPMCGDCAKLLTNSYKHKFDQSQREKEAYLSFLKKLKEREADDKAAEGHVAGKIAESIEELKGLRQLEDEKLTELQELEATHELLNSELDELEESLRQLNEQDLNKVLAMRNDLTMRLSEKNDDLDQARSLYQQHLNHVDRLRSLNIFSRLFSILFSDTDKWGRINGFRLGYKVPLAEINAALGQIVLMLVFLQKRLDVVVTSYELVPLGSKSYIVKHSRKPPTEDGVRPKTTSVLQLFSTNEFTLGKLFNFNKLDVSMIALLDIVSHFETKMVSSDEELAFPYRISPKHDSIGGKSIRVTSNDEWTDACRYLLIDLNWLLTYASTHCE